MQTQTQTLAPAQSAVKEKPYTLTVQTLYPLLIERRLVRRIWGGQRIADWLNLAQPESEQIGESWEVFDNNIILNGSLVGQTLAQATATFGADLVGTRTVERYGSDFPLLTKFLDAREQSSIQVHPDDAYAHAYETATGFHGKNEAWYILDAEPGATIISGLKSSCSRAEFATAVENGELEPLLHYEPVKAGDTVFIPAGTVHTINKGILLFEIQEKSDLTYRVYDYGRVDAVTGKPRELHLDKALDVIDFAASPRCPSQAIDLDPEGKRRLLMSCPYFALEHWNISREHTWSTNPGSLEIVTVIDNQGMLSWKGGKLKLFRGDSIVLPASLGTCSLKKIDVPGTSTSDRRSSQSDLRVLRTYVPEP